MPGWSPGDRGLLFLLQLKAAAGYQLSAFALTRPQHPVAAGVCFMILAGLRPMLPLPTHSYMADINNPPQ